MKVKPWMWFAGAVGAFILLKDQVSKPVKTTGTVALVAGRTYEITTNMGVKKFVTPVDTTISVDGVFVKSVREV